jgi:hypothetical protein
MDMTVKKGHRYGQHNLDINRAIDMDILVKKDHRYGQHNLDIKGPLLWALQ